MRRRDGAAAALAVFGIAAAVLTPLTLSRPERPVSAPTEDGSDQVSGPTLTTDGGERHAEVVALMAERYAPDAAHGTTDDNAVRRALRVAARSRRW
jgi:hypothetical protein